MSSLVLKDDLYGHTLVAAMAMFIVAAGLFAAATISRRRAVRLAGEVREGRLGDFLGELRGADLAERGGEDQIKVTADQLGEGTLGVLPGVARKQLQVRVAHLQEYIAANIKTGRKNHKRGTGRTPSTRAALQPPTAHRRSPVWAP